ncbi:hypothetical protein [Nitrosopumilus ureiphilus]|uniref:Uncharacterized protein n=1 Tax=Nitrosopumilus ureiphilus TaxID=1470067 RepID=A0A7D5M6Q7_9ARCH|nr:hypothetical protein [Nitrosopumilus ureiphilus]QLH06307.1 hypothetical protein C5F50_03865 [Nitrosopumilus ureiphilus]
MIDFMLAAVVSAFLNIALLLVVIGTYLQNMKVIRSYYTSGLVLVAALLMLQNIVIVLFWSTLYMDDKSLMMSADMVSHYLFVINIIQTVGLSILVWITRR